MSFTRRDTLRLAMGTAFAAAIPFKVFADVDSDVAAFTEGAEIGEGGITLIAPEIAENGNTVPIEVDAPGAVAILVLATGNPTPAVGTFNFGPLAGAQMASTRIRLAGTQDVLAIAKMADGTFVQARQEVKVTIGGCGG
ncbi:sulfur-oxidizing protein SoxY [Octadecabacter temperatus]|uniref:Sulfur oxidation protein SoxY n=1 Tax=Octadecabacter temperatus TaxID=1458307 RepID=A0A0K0Y4F0_9RHOB|nr:thiosulfate oxidation carrier protein SoxY [Octadecabacter temperatus]AKS45873.1 sulfur oxidation protein SoxY [Octadecabacter temperatus]SIO02462.1 sulfur-oxidizing protein SoxY [Octadecabacter temperatus]